MPTSITLKVLHDIVQATIGGWMDYHLWQFVIDGRTYGLPTTNWARPAEGGREGPAARCPEARRDRHPLHYDFGDDWVHEIRIRDIRQGEPGVGYPRYIAHNGPPEGLWWRAGLLRRPR